MTEAPKPLTFAAVDDLAFASDAGHLDLAHTPLRFIPRTLGPLLELLQLMAGKGLPASTATSWLARSGASPMIRALAEQRERWTGSDGRRMGFIKAIRTSKDAESDFTGFLIDAQRAAREVTRLPGHAPGQLVAAMRELESNIHEHSEAAGTGLVAFRAASDRFEFAVTDRGDGVLKSLRRSQDYAALADHGKALEAALTDGVSRFGRNSGRGHGFRPVFLGLANLTGSLRFRSGDHALVVDGANPDLAIATLAQKAPIDGFFVSVACMKPLRMR
jgi:hypothetical protein